MTYNSFLQNIIPDYPLTHLHHIIPKSEGGTDDSSNMVELSPSQHFWAHILYDREHGTRTAKRFLNYSHIQPECYEDCLIYNQIEKERREKASRVNKVRLKGNQYALGHHWNLIEETKKRMSEAKKGNQNAPTKKVLQFSKDGQFIAEYPSISEAERQTGVNHGNIIKCCHGKFKSSGGYVWKYLD